MQRDTRMQEMFLIYINVLDCQIAHASDDIFLMKILRHVTFNKYSTMTMLYGHHLENKPLFQIERRNHYRLPVVECN